MHRRTTEQLGNGMIINGSDKYQGVIEHDTVPRPNDEGGPRRTSEVVLAGVVVGLAVAREVLRHRPTTTVSVLEVAPQIATGQTGHNSGVVHVDLYYSPGSFKARIARADTEALRGYARERDIGWQEIGKILVSTSAEKTRRLRAIAERATENKVPWQRITAPEPCELESEVQVLEGLLLPTTAILGYVAMCDALRSEIEQHGGRVVTTSEVKAIEERPESGEAVIRTPIEEHRARIFVACAETQADRVARMRGLKTNFRIIPLGGQYYQLPERMSEFVHRFIYPASDPNLFFLGIHVSPTTTGSITVGSNAVLGLPQTQGRRTFDARDAIIVASFLGPWKFAALHLGTSERNCLLSRRAYARRFRAYLPDFTAADLLPYPTSTRAPAIRRDGSLVEDFLVRSAIHQGHVCNTPSPATTAALPIAAMIVDTNTRRTGS